MTNSTGVQSSLGAHPAADLDAVHPGQPDVEDDRGGPQPAHGGERGRAVALDLHAEPVAAQVEPDEVGDRPVVLDDEDQTARFGFGSGHGYCLSAGGCGADRVTVPGRSPQHGHRPAAPASA